jgi:hypothetical protein
MAIRARIQNSSDWQTGACYTGSTIYDHDDLVFTVQNPPSSFTCGVYNADFQAPVCYGDGWCGTCNLVPCRGTINDRAESPAGFFQCPTGTFPGRRYLTTLRCSGGPDWYILRYTFRLDNVEGWHAVRVVEGYCASGGVPCAPATSICPSEYTRRDADDFVFYVKAKPPSSLPVCAVYDNTTSDGDPAYLTPKCPAGATMCSTCDLIKSRDNIAGGAEPNQPNNLFGACADGTAGTYLMDESIERIEIRDLSGSGTFQPGASVEVNVLVYCYPPEAYFDYLEILYSPDADSPTFTKVATSTCSSGGGYYLHGVTITLGNRVGRHVIRAIFRYGAFAAGTTCASVNDGAGSAGSQNYGDTDDLVFLVGVPAAPSNFNAEGVSPDSLTLSWSDVQGEDNYELRWTDTFTTDFSRWQVLKSPVDPNTTWYVDRPLPEGTYRCYAIRACNGNGCSDFVWDCATIPIFECKLCRF